MFAAIISALAQTRGEPYLSFPLHMMRYGEGGVGLWGSLCGTVNGGAAILGLLVPEKASREQLIAELFARHLQNEYLGQANDGAVLPIQNLGSRLVMANKRHMKNPSFRNARFN